MNSLVVAFEFRWRGIRCSEEEIMSDGEYMRPYKHSLITAALWDIFILCCRRLRGAEAEKGDQMSIGTKKNAYARSEDKKLSAGSRRRSGHDSRRERRTGWVIPRSDLDSCLRTGGASACVAGEGST